jgi:hypothetical protein
LCARARSRGRAWASWTTHHDVVEHAPYVGETVLTVVTTVLQTARAYDLHAPQAEEDGGRRLKGRGGSVCRAARRAPAHRRNRADHSSHLRRGRLPPPFFRVFGAQAEGPWARLLPPPRIRKRGAHRRVLEQ